MTMISSAADCTQCRLLCGLRLVTCFRGWAQHYGMTLRLSDFVCVSHQIQNLMLSLHWEEDRRDRDGLYRKARSCRYSGAASIFARLCIAWIGLDVLAEMMMMIAFI